MSSDFKRTDRIAGDDATQTVATHSAGTQGSASSLPL